MSPIEFFVFLLIGQVVAAGIGAVASAVITKRYVLRHLDCYLSKDGEPPEKCRCRGVWNG